MHELFTLSRPTHLVLKNRTRGVVFIEGLLALSLMIVIILATRFLHKAHQRAFAERARVRYCVWHSAFAGCEQNASGCDSATLSEDATNEGEEESLEMAQQTGSESANQRIREESKGMKRRVTFTTENELLKPRPLGGQLYQWNTRFSLPCNPKDSQFNISPDGAFRDFK